MKHDRALIGAATLAMLVTAPIKARSRSKTSKHKNAGRLMPPGVSAMIFARSAYRAEIFVGKGSVIARLPVGRRLGGRAAETERFAHLAMTKGLKVKG